MIFTPNAKTIWSLLKDVHFGQKQQILTVLKQGLVQSCKFPRPLGQRKQLGVIQRSYSQEESRPNVIRVIITFSFLTPLLMQTAWKLSDGREWVLHIRGSLATEEWGRGGHPPSTLPWEERCTPGQQLHLQGLAEQWANWSTWDSHHNFSIMWRHCLPKIYCLESYKCQLRLGSRERAITDPHDTVKPLFTPSSLQMGRLCRSCFLSSPAAKRQVLTSSRGHRPSGRHARHAPS